MKESLLTVTLMILVYSFGTALNRPAHTDVMSDSHIGPALRAMVLEGRVAVLTDQAQASGLATR